VAPQLDIRRVAVQRQGEPVPSPVTTYAFPACEALPGNGKAPTTRATDWRYQPATDFSKTAASYFLSLYSPQRHASTNLNDACVLSAKRR